GGSILGRWWRYKWITFHPSLTGRGFAGTQRAWHYHDETGVPAN
ncbi:hypothetical protein YPPY09_3779, partial [Yersinia pestis PY-09]